MSIENNNLYLRKLIFYNKLFSYSLSSLVLILYFSFILILAFAPDIFGILIFDSSISLGIFLGLIIIIISIFLTFVYVLLANLFLDKLKDKIQ